MRKILKFLGLVVFVFTVANFVDAEVRPTASDSKSGVKEKPMVQKMNQNGDVVKNTKMPIVKTTNRPMTMGVVTNIEGDRITIESNIVNPKEKEGNKKLSFLIESASAIFYQSKLEVSISNVKIGDKIMVEGEIEDNKILATRVHIGDFSAWKNPNLGIKNGTGEPVVVAKVKEVNTENKTLTVTNKKKETYTVKLDYTEIVKNGENAELNQISKNDVVLVQGEINETTLNASTISVQPKNNGERIQVLKRVGEFFSKLFKTK